MAPYAQITVVVVFVIAYLFIMRYYAHKAKIVGISLLVLLVTNILTPLDLFTFLNWNVLGIYFGMLFVIEALVYSKFPDYLAGAIINKAKSVSTVLLLIAVVSGFISIALQNVAVVLIVAPIALAITRKLRISPVPVLIAVAISANIQGVATLIGDTPSMLLSAHAKFTFNDFFFYDGKPSLFFAVQVGALASVFVLYLFFRKLNRQHRTFRAVLPKSAFPALLLLIMIVLLSFSSLIDPGFTYLAGTITLVCGAIAMLWYYHHARSDVIPMLGRLDFETGFFLAGIFILVGSLVKVGIVDYVAAGVVSVTGQNLLFAYVVIIVISLVFSSVIDNIPFIAAMLPVVEKISVAAGFEPTLLYFGLLIGASVGGNITPIGASANIIAMGMAEKEGYKTSFFGFVKEGLPFTLAAVTASCVFMYFFFG